MRKLKLQVQMTLGGSIAGPQGEMDWMTLPWTEDVEEYVTRITDPVDTILLGRKLAEGFIPYWAGVAADPNNPEAQAGKKFRDTPKVVFTKTMDPSGPAVTGWPNTTLATGNLAEEVHRIKNQPGGDVITYGGGTFVSALIKGGLVDEFHLFLNPVAMGQGMAIFNELETPQHFALADARAFHCGITVLQYTVKKK